MKNINWETRAKERRIENKALKKRIKEITQSRDFWKNKYMKQKESFNDMQNKLSIIKKNIQKIVKL